MKCPICKSKKTHEISNDRRASGEVMGPSKTVTGLALKVAFTGAKLAFTKLYECGECQHRWRKWFE